MKRRFIRVLELVDTVLVRKLPHRLSKHVRPCLLRACGAHIEEDVILGQGVRVLASQNLVLRRGASVARDCVLDARGGLEIGTNALIGFESILLTSTHNSSDITTPVQDQGMFALPVSIGARAWLGTRVIVQPGVQIGADTIVGSAAVVTSNVESRAIYAGIPARKLRDR